MSDPEPDSFSVVPGSRLQYEPFKDRGQVRRFDSGEPELDSFLNSEEVEEYERDNFGKTTLVFLDGALVAYYTICADGLRVEYVDARKMSGSHFKQETRRMEVYPALKIGRLAVQKEWQGKDIGTALVRRIAAIAVRAQPAVRLLTLNAKPRAVGFYEKFGFTLTNAVHRERGRIDRTMYLDVLAIEDAVLAPDP